MARGLSDAAVGASVDCRGGKYKADPKDEAAKLRASFDALGK